MNLVCQEEQTTYIVIVKHIEKALLLPERKEIFFSLVFQLRTVKIFGVTSVHF